MDRHLGFCLGFLLLLSAFGHAQTGSVVERVYAAVMGPSPLATNISSPIFSSRKVEPGQAGLVKSLRQYIEREPTRPGGLYVSSLDSANWQCVSWPNTRLRSFAMSMATGKPQLLLGLDEGVLRPFTNPTGWQLVTDWQMGQILDLERDPFRDQILYIGTTKGIFISMDGGTTWRPANEGLGSLFVSCLLPDSKQKSRVLAGTENGLYQSIDGGATWQLMALSGVPVRALLREPQSWPGIFWVGTERHGLYESYDGGQTFAPVSIGEDSVSIYTLAGGGSNAPIFAGAYRRGIFFASSVGQDWRQMPGSERLGSVLCILPMDDRKTLYAGTHDGGVFISRDAGASWQDFGLNGLQVRQLIIGEPTWIKP
jgi:hypothetical protein